MLREISITEIGSIKIGHAQNLEQATGCTVILCEKGAPTGVDVRGGGPASRESALLNPLAANEGVHGVLLSGGSAFGLDAAGGVMRYLAERNIGFPVGDVVVPIVCQSCIFDLQLAANAHPDQEMAYEACKNAEKNMPAQGNVGAGTGATVGKLLGPAGMMNSGLGIYAAAVGDLKMGAVVAVNALGDIYDYRTNRKLAGLCDPKTGSFLDSEETMYAMQEQLALNPHANTTIGAVITNAAFTKTQLAKIAGMAHNGYARSIRPVHTTADGDTIYAMSAGEVRADINVAGTLAARVISEAVKRAVLEAGPMYGLKCADNRAAL